MEKRLQFRVAVLALLWVVSIFMVPRPSYPAVIPETARKVVHHVWTEAQADGRRPVSDAAQQGLAIRYHF